MLLLILWIVITIGIGVWASKWGRNGIGWAVFSLAATPLIAAIVLLICGNNMKKEFTIKGNEDGTQTVSEHKVAQKGTNPLYVIGYIFAGCFIYFWGSVVFAIIYSGKTSPSEIIGIIKTAWGLVF
jgi:ABC-type Fe3+ transport system permease subunit